MISLLRSRLFEGKIDIIFNIDNIFTLFFANGCDRLPPTKNRNNRVSVLLQKGNVKSSN